MEAKWGREENICYICPDSGFNVSAASDDNWPIYLGPAGETQVLC